MTSTIALPPPGWYLLRVTDAMFVIGRATDAEDVTDLTRKILVSFQIMEGPHTGYVFSNTTDDGPPHLKTHLGRIIHAAQRWPDRFEVMRDPACLIGTVLRARLRHACTTGMMFVRIAEIFINTNIDLEPGLRGRPIGD